MIEKLGIRNYVLIDSLDLRFDRGLTIITGETGAGKSILLGALGLVLGDRAESGVQTDPEQKTVIEASFRIGDYALQEFFTENDLDYHPELIIRREMSPQGRSRAFINDTPASLALLRELGRQLIDIHQQFDQLDVLGESFQLDMLDALAAQRDKRADYRQSFQQWKKTSERLERLREERDRFEQERDFLAFQLSELESARPLPGELAALEGEEKTLRHAEEIRQVLRQAQAALTEADGAALEQLQAIAQALQPLRTLDPEVRDLAARMDSLLIELQDWADSADARADKAEGDPARLAELEMRLNILNRLVHKHKVSDTDALLELASTWQTRLDGLANSEEEITGMEARCRELEAECRQKAIALSKGRTAAAEPFVSGVQYSLADLGMERMRLRLCVTPGDTLQAHGLDGIRFEMAQMEGARFAPIRQAASGGELSRLTLVIKSLVAAAIPLPTLVFDEIDAGVSGAVSTRVGDILTRMAVGHQLIVITHSPQIAARAGKHLFVSKGLEEGQVQTRVRELEGQDRVRALATMLSTDPPGPAALANARELLQAAGQATKTK
jgi:DNA repair protein RecN (Recombination protein N)